MPKTSKSKNKRAAKSGVKSEKTNTKGAAIVELLRRKQGATLTELTEATGWQSHSVRGFLSAQVGKKLGLKLQSSKREDGQRVYQVPA